MRGRRVGAAADARPAHWLWPAGWLGAQRKLQESSARWLRGICARWQRCSRLIPPELIYLRLSAPVLRPRASRASREAWQQGDNLAAPRIPLNLAELHSAEAALKGGCLGGGTQSLPILRRRRLQLQLHRARSLSCRSCASQKRLPEKATRPAAAKPGQPSEVAPSERTR